MKRKNLGTRLMAAGLTCALLLTGCGGSTAAARLQGQLREAKRRRRGGTSYHYGSRADE